MKNIQPKILFAYILPLFNDVFKWVDRVTRHQQKLWTKTDYFFKLLSLTVLCSKRDQIKFYISLVIRVSTNYHTPMIKNIYIFS